MMRVSDERAMSELLPVVTAPFNISNDQRHDAALTIVEHSDSTPQTVALLLAMMGLAAEDANGAFRPIGTDEFEIPWFTPAHRFSDASAR